MSEEILAEAFGRHYTKKDLNDLRWVLLCALSECDPTESDFGIGDDMLNDISKIIGKG